MNSKTIAELLREYRRAENISQRELSKLCGGVFSENYISEMESGKYCPSKKRIMQFCENLKINATPFLEAVFKQKLLKK